jgi:transcriptional regulator GlxA family with amidase domain
MKIAILILNGVFDTGLSALLDTLTTANELTALVDSSLPRFDLTLVGLGGDVRTAQGLSVPVAPIHAQPRPDLVLLPALAAKMPDPLSQALDHRDIAEAGVLLRSYVSQGIGVGAACTATFIVAAASLLDGHRATTTWWLAPLFRARYPKVVLNDSQMVVESGQFITAGAAFAHFDLALHIVRRISPALAALTTRYLLMDHRPSQATFAIPSHVAHADPLIEQFEEWVRLHLAEGFSLEAVAAGIGTSKRTLARRLQASLGKSPVAYVQDIRVEQATYLLQSSDLSVEEIARRVGYTDAVTLRTLLQQKKGRSIRELRIHST